MRILVISAHLPWPLCDGGSAAQFSTLKCLSQEHEFTVIVPISNTDQKRNLAEVSAALPNVKWRGVIYYEEMPVWKARLVRVAHKVLGRLRRALKISQNHRPINFQFDPFRPPPRALIDAVSEEVTSKFDLCQVEFAEMLPLGSWLPKKLPKLFVHHQIHFVYSERSLSTQKHDIYAEYLSATMRVQEIAYLENFNGIITFSEVDRRVLSSQIENKNIWISPFPIPADVNLSDEISDSFDGRFLFLASEVHDPNVDSLKWLLGDIWPRIEVALPSSKLVIIGKWKDSVIEQLSTAKITFTGFVTELEETIRGGILLVPLRIGSGIRAKILVALALGIPVVSTSVGAEGLLVEDGKQLLIRNTVNSFADAALDLAQDPKLRRNLAAAGCEVVRMHYSPGAVRTRRNEIYSLLASKKCA